MKRSSLPSDICHMPQMSRCRWRPGQRRAVRPCSGGRGSVSRTALRAWRCARLPRWSDEATGTRSEGLDVKGVVVLPRPGSGPLARCGARCARAHWQLWRAPVGLCHCPLVGNELRSGWGWTISPPMVPDFPRLWPRHLGRGPTTLDEVTVCSPLARVSSNRLASLPVDVVIVTTVVGRFAAQAIVASTVRIVPLRDSLVALQVLPSCAR